MTLRRKYNTKVSFGDILIEHTYLVVVLQHCAREEMDAILLGEVRNVRPSSFDCGLSVVEALTQEKCFHRRRTRAKFDAFP